MAEKRNPFTQGTKRSSSPKKPLPQKTDDTGNKENHTPQSQLPQKPGTTSSSPISRARVRNPATVNSSKNISRPQLRKPQPTQKATTQQPQQEKHHETKTQETTRTPHREQNKPKENTPNTSTKKSNSTNTTSTEKSPNKNSPTDYDNTIVHPQRHSNIHNKSHRTRPDNTNTDNEIKPKKQQPDKTQTEDKTLPNTSSYPTVPALEKEHNTKESTREVYEHTEPEKDDEESFDAELEEFLSDEETVEEIAEPEKPTENAPAETLNSKPKDKENKTPNTPVRKKAPTTEHQREKFKSTKKANYDKERILSRYAKKHKTPTVSYRKRNKHLTEQGTVTGRQIQFYKNLNLRYTYDQNKVADLLSPPSDKQETKEEKRKRERLIKQAIGGEEALKRNSKLRITPKQIEDLRFLAMFRYANAKQIAKKNAEREDTARKRLNTLRDRGLILSNKIYGTKPVYFLSQEGMILSGYNYKTLMKNDINLSSLSHTFGINHIAACLHGATVDILGLNESFGDGTWPTKNRRTIDNTTGNYVLNYGENIVSEYEIQSHLGRRRQNFKGEIYKPKAQADIKYALDEWNQRLREIKQIPDRSEAKKLLREHVFNSPEMIHENEWMWALFPHNPPKLMHHVPDLVVKRPRNPDGSPNSIAVELELNLKENNESYVKTLTAFKNDENMYAEVVWIAPSTTIRNRIEKIAKEVGLWETGKIRIIPLYYEHGEWKDGHMWLL